MRLLLTFPIIGLINLFGISLINIPHSLSAELLSQNIDQSAQRVSRSTTLPMRLELAVEQEMYIMTVPNPDINQSAYGGELSFYDVHIAKMFEITYNDCQEIQRRVPEGIEGRQWLYRWGNGDDDMPTEYFYISCNLAYEIVDTYGLGKAEETVVEAFVEQNPTASIRTDLIPILDITGSKVSQWQDFAREFEYNYDEE
ncbi:MAG: hypothetical protein WBA77_07205 [Microcoleaceae cyanobacterium]